MAKLDAGLRLVSGVVPLGENVEFGDWPEKRESGETYPFVGGERTPKPFGAVDSIERPAKRDVGISGFVVLREWTLSPLRAYATGSLSNFPVSSSSLINVLLETVAFARGD